MGPIDTKPLDCLIRIAIIAIPVAAILTVVEVIRLVNWLFTHVSFSWN